MSACMSIRKSERLFTAASWCESWEVVTVAAGDGRAHHRHDVEGVDAGLAPGCRRLGRGSVGARAGDVWGRGRGSEPLRWSEPREREPGVGVPEATPIRTAADELPSSRAGSMCAAVDHLALSALHLPTTNTKVFVQHISVFNSVQFHTHCRKSTHCWLIPK